MLTDVNLLLPAPIKMVVIILMHALFPFSANPVEYRSYKHCILLEVKGPLLLNYY